MRRSDRLSRKFGEVGKISEFRANEIIMAKVTKKIIGKAKLVTLQQLGLCYLKSELESKLNVINNLPPTGHEIVGYRVSILNHANNTISLEFIGIGSDAKYYGNEEPVCTYLDITPPFDKFSIISGQNSDNNRPYVDGDYKFKNHKSAFKIAFFGRNSIEIILANSLNVVFSGCMLSVQHSSYYEIGDNSKSKYFSLKAEGDWQDSSTSLVNDDGVTVPAIIYGPPCPPIWQNWMNIDIYKLLARKFN